MKKRVLGCILLCLCFIMTGCKAPSVSDPQADIKNAAVEVIDHLNEGNYEEIFANGNDMLQDELSPANLEDLFKQATEGIGDFEKITDHIIDQNDQEITDIVVASYENGELRFTLGFDENLKLCYLYIK